MTLEALAWPAELTPELADILGRPCCMFISLAQAYRAGGVEIETSAEAEQAFFLHKFIGFWFAHGAGWRDAAMAEIQEKRAHLLAQKDHTPS